MRKRQNRNLLIETKIQRKIDRNQFWYFMYLIIIRYITNYANIIFSFIFPMVWLISGYYIWAKQAGLFAPEYYLSFYTSYSLMPAASLGLMSLALTFGADRINNMNKIYATLNISPLKYFLANYITVFIQFFLISKEMISFYLLKNIFHYFLQVYIHLVFALFFQLDWV